MAFMKKIGIIWRCANLYRTQKFEPLGINCYQYSYILNVCANPGISQDKLARAIFIHKSNAARQLSVLEEKGFIERQADVNDKRSLLVYPTQKALDAVPKIRSVLKEWNELLFKDFDENEKQILEDVTDKLCERAKEMADKIGGDGEY